jgi:hypothetical protein
MRRPPKSGRRGREPFAHQPMDSGTWAECCLTKCYGRSSNPSGFHDIRSGRRCGIRPGEARPGHRATRTAIQCGLLCDLLLHRRSRFGHCRSGSRLRRIVRLCWRHSRRGRNGQSRCAGRLQCRASTGLAGRNQLLVVDWQWRLLMSRPAPPETCGKASIRLGPAAPACAPRPSLRQAHGGDLLSAIASIRRASEDRVSARLPPTGSPELRSLAIRIAVRLAAGSCRSVCKLSKCQ